MHGAPDSLPVTMNPDGGDPFPQGATPIGPPTGSGVGTPPSLATNSIARLASDVWTLTMSLIAATVTARLLSPAGKGFYSTLILLAGVFMQLFGGGLAEAAVILSGQGRFHLRAAVSGTLAAVLPLSAIGGLIFVIVARLALQPGSGDEQLAVNVGGVLVGVMVVYTTAFWVIIAEERIALAAGLAAVLATVTTLSLWVIMALSHMRVAGAMLGGLAGATLVLLTAGIALRRLRLLPRPRWVSGFLGPAARMGAHLQLSSLLVTLTSRLDLMLVYRLKDPAAAGNYSVALTIGALVGAVPVAVAFASFPRLARVNEGEARELTAQLYRMGLIMAGVVGCALALLTPLAVPVVFGPNYRAAVAPTLLLIPAGVLWSAQWLLCRGAVARGQPQPLSASFGVSFVVMVIADVVLIPRLGVVGAGLGTLIASLVGFAIAVGYHRRWGWPWSALIPRSADFVALRVVVRQLLPARLRGET